MTTNIRIGDRIFFRHRQGSADPVPASGLVLEISRPKVGKGPEYYRVACDTPSVWIGTYDPKTKTRIVHVPQREVWRLK